MVSRRRVLELASGAAVSFAGCNTVESGIDEPTPTGSAAESPEPPPEGSGTVRDVREFGAAVDGSTDDTGAVRAAFDAAEDGDTILFPEGTTLVSATPKNRAGEAAITIDGASCPDDLTVRGEGRESVVKLAGGHEADHIVFEILVGPGIDGLLFERLTVDGNKTGQIQEAGKGGFNFATKAADDATVEPDVTWRDVWSVNSNQNGFLVAHGGCTLDRCTATGCNLHGFALDSWGKTNNSEALITVRNSYASGNGLYGVDCSGGRILVEDFVGADNEQGTKTTPEVIETTYRRCRFTDNTTLGYNRPTSATETGERARVTFTNVISEGNGSTGFRFGIDTDYTVDTILARRNNTTKAESANVLIRDDAVVDASLVLSFEAVKGTGLQFGSSEPSRIGTYVHGGNAAGSLAMEADGLEIENSYRRDEYGQLQMERALDEFEGVDDLLSHIGTGIDTVPTADQVGAGSAR